MKKFLCTLVVLLSFACVSSSFAGKPWDISKSASIVKLENQANAYKVEVWKAHKELYGDKPAMDVIQWLAFKLSYTKSQELEPYQRMGIKNCISEVASKLTKKERMTIAGEFKRMGMLYAYNLVNLEEVIEEHQSIYNSGAKVKACTGLIYYASGAISERQREAVRDQLEVWTKRMPRRDRYSVINVAQKRMLIDR